VGTQLYYWEDFKGLVAKRSYFTSPEAPEGVLDDKEGDFNKIYLFKISLFWLFSI
jgi:hypothetical protein